MRKRIISMAAVLALFAPCALAQSAFTPPSQTAVPVLPALRDYTNPNANITPMDNGLGAGRLFAPAAPIYGGRQRRRLR